MVFRVNHSGRWSSLRRSGLLLWLAALAFAPLKGHAGQDLMQTHYPTRLKEGDTANERARPWQFGTGDIFQIAGFTNIMARNLRLQTGMADVGFGHCADGVVWGLVIPRQNGLMSSPATNTEESVAHVWLRFHPSLVDVLFPPSSVMGPGSTNLLAEMNAIAAHKFRSAFHAGDNALIPKPNDVIIDVDTPERLRRFFIVDRAEKTAAYANAFEHQAFRPHPALTPELAAQTFDQIWDNFDTTYAMFIIRPEVDWDRSRDEWRPKALACQTSDEFAAICAEMLKPLRDLHISLNLAGSDIPVFDRPRPANSNPPAHKKILGDLHVAGRLQWAVTPDNIGFAAIYGWDDGSVPDAFDQALEQMRKTRGLIVDVRWNAGGNEVLAQKVAGRFLQKETIYAYDQFRDGLERTNLTKKFPRKAEPRGLWRYDKPVILLIGQKCMSSGESFVGMMLGATNVTTMGDHTCGSSGNPQVLELPLEMTVGVPRWIDYLPDGTPIDEHGFKPQIPFTAPADGLSGSRDDLLTAALERLREKK